MVGQQMAPSEAIGLAAITAWAGGLVYLATRFGERASMAAPTAHPLNVELFATALVVVVGTLFVIRELLVLPAAAPPSMLLQRPVLVVAALVVTAVLVLAEAHHLGRLGDWFVLVPLAVIVIGAGILHPKVDGSRIRRVARGRP
jgi:hypothetical protein